EVQITDVFAYVYFNNVGGLWSGFNGSRVLAEE
ncbi:unnamed protein product, partial [marine sediment metagenome]